MIFKALPLGGAFIVDIEPLRDERGFFARTFCREEFDAIGLETVFVQSSVSYNTRKGTMRGMHYQTEPHPETKLVRCTMGSIFDVIIDLRPDSPTFRKWYSAELSARNRSLLYIPSGFAHGFLTLEDETEVFYQMNESYQPECTAGVRHDDPAFAIDWPLPVRVISPRDAAYKDFRP